MAARSYDWWVAPYGSGDGWKKGTSTLTTTSSYIVFVGITGGNEYYGIDKVVDGETYTSMGIYAVTDKDIIQPSHDPFVSSVVSDITHNPAGAGFIYPGYNKTHLTQRGNYWYGEYVVVGAQISGTRSVVDYSFETEAEFFEALDNGEITPIDQTVYFDIYVNGTDKPSIMANWTAGEGLGVSLSPRVWIGCEDLDPLLPEYVTDTETGLVDVNNARWNEDSAGSFSYGGSYDTTYLTIQQHFEQYLNPISKMQVWGLNGEPEYVKLYLRMVDPTPGEGLDGIGQLATVTINKDGTASYIMVDGSSASPGFYTVVRLHLQEEPDYVLPDEDPDYPHGSNIDGDGPGKYDPDNIPDPDDFTTPGGFDGNNVLTKTYAVSSATLQNIGQKLWSQDYFNVLKIQNNPMENIVSVKYFPFSQTGTNEEIKVGDIAFGINGIKVPSVYTKVIGHYKHIGHFKSFLDYAPYTAVKLFLPYIGWIQLDPADIMGCELYVTYYIDLVTGQCMARLRLDENQDGKAMPFMTCFGNMGVDIPLSASDRVQTEIRAISSGVSALGGLQGHLIQGPAGFGGAIGSVAQGALNIAGMDYTSQRTSNQSPVCSTFDCQDVYVMVERPAEEYVEPSADTGYKHLHGYPTNKYLTLSKIPAGKFVQVDMRTDLQIAATSEENAMLERMLTEGVYV